MNNIFSDIANWVQNYFANMSNAELYSTLTIVGSAIFFILAERIWPYTKGQKVLREGFFDDLALYTIAQSYILGILIFTYVINFIEMGMSSSCICEMPCCYSSAGLSLLLEDSSYTFTHRYAH